DGRGRSKASPLISVVRERQAYNSRSELGRQLLNALHCHIDGDRGRCLAAPRPMFVWPRHMGGSQADRGSSAQIAGMRRHHHASFGLQIEGLRGGKIDARLRLIIAGNLSPENRIPGKAVAARQIHHEGNIAVRYWRDHVTALEPSETGRHVGPRVEAMPRQIKRSPWFLTEVADTKPLKRAFEIAPM